MIKINKRLAAALLVPMVAAGIGLAKADDELAVQTMEATLANSFDISTNGGNTHANINPATGALSSALTPSFRVNSNEGTVIFLKAFTNDEAGTEVPALFKPGGLSPVFIALSNTTTKPDTASINNAIMGTPALADNKNVIAYQLEDIRFNSGSSATAAYQPSGQRFNISILPGVTDITMATLTSARPETYSTADDSVGTYSATVMLSVAQI